MEEQRGEDREFLPPEPPGPEPELGEGGAKPQPPPPPPQAPPPQAPPPPQPGYAPPAYAPQPGWQAPPPQWHGQPPAPPPGGWQQPPPAYGAPPPGYVYPQPPVPDNGPAIAGFVLSISSAFLLLTSAGLSSIFSIGGAIAGMIYSRRGKRRVDEGETPKHRGLAQAGWITGIITLVMSVLATLFWLLLILLAIFSEDFREGLEEEDSGDFDSTRAALALAAAGARATGLLG